MHVGEGTPTEPKGKRKKKNGVLTERPKQKNNKKRFYFKGGR